MPSLHWNRCRGNDKFLVEARCVGKAHTKTACSVGCSEVDSSGCSWGILFFMYLGNSPLFQRSGGRFELATAAVTAPPPLQGARQRTAVFRTFLSYSLLSPAVDTSHPYATPVFLRGICVSCCARGVLSLHFLARQCLSSGAIVCCPTRPPLLPDRPSHRTGKLFSRT